MADSLSVALSYLERQFGKGIATTLDAAVDKKDCIPTGHPFVDYVLGGGFYFGKHHEVFGMESSGKSTLCYQTAIQCQRMKFNTGRVLLLDYENAWSKSYFKKLGGQITGDKFMVSQPETAEDGMEVMRVFIDEELVDLIIVDSVSAMCPEDEEAIYYDTSGKEVDLSRVTDKTKQTGHMGRAKIGSQSLVMSQGLKQLSSRINRKRVCVIWINQVRTKINTTGGKTTETTSGGNALRFYAAVRLELRKIGATKGKLFDPIENKIKEGIVAIQTVVKGAKNKEAPPFREAPIEVRFGQGIDVEKGILEFAVAQKLIAKGGGGWFETKDIGASRNARGIEDFRKLRIEEPQMWETLLKKCNFEKAMDGMNASVVAVEDDVIPAPAAEVTITNGDDSEIDVSSVLGTGAQLASPESGEVSKAQQLIDSLP